MCHDLPEAITGDITKFQGVSKEEIKIVTNSAIDYLSNKFNYVIDLKTILTNYENKYDIESKVVHMIDKVHSSTTFIKYQSEKDVDMNNPQIIPVLRNNPFVVAKISEGKDLADIFFDFHIREVKITAEECENYNIIEEDATTIVNTISAFAKEMYHQKQLGTLLDVSKDFPSSAMKYNEKRKIYKSTKIVGSKN